MRARNDGTSLVLAVFVLALLLRALSLLPLVIDDDEAWFAASGAAMRGFSRFYSTALDNKPPGTAWFYHVVSLLGGAKLDPRPARVAQLVVVVLSAMGIGRCAELVARARGDGEPSRSLFGLSRRGWIGASAALVVTALPSPKMLATTSEGLMLPLLVWVALTWLRMLTTSPRPSAGRLVSAGVALGLCLLFKQTALFFAVFSLGAQLVLRRTRKTPFSGLFLFWASALAVVAVGVWLTGPRQLFYWSFTYPAVHLTKVRASLFNEWREGLCNAAVFCVGLWPVVLSVRFLRSRTDPAGAWLLGLWLAAGCGAVLAGKALFFHYFLFLAPPLCVLYAQSGAARGRLWLGAGYAVVCLVAANPTLGAFWGTDLSYYAKVGRVVRELTSKDESIFVWGGNALPLAASGRGFSTRFVTARLAAPPYATPETSRLFEAEFRKNPPKLFIDLHERGDCGFNVPVDSRAWLASELKRNYRARREPSLPWVTFYVRAPGSGADDRRPAASVAEPPDLVDEPLERLLALPVTKLVGASLRNLDHALALEPLARALDSLDRLRGDEREPSVRELRSRRRLLSDAVVREVGLVLGTRHAVEKTRLAGLDRALALDTLARLESEFRRRRRPLPLSLESPLWWVSLALVKLQPVALKRDSPAQRTL
ncbi:MAG: hypothetical protein HY075_14170 [Deltaproteobacteria bacterium]|nr:hypothetical protein [Deltaproteobacteria bacterium]